MAFEDVRRQGHHYRDSFQLPYGSTWILLQIKTIVSLIFEFVGFVKLVQNWYAPLFVRFSPRATRDTEIEVRTRSGLKYIIRPKRGELSILNEVLHHNIYARQLPAGGTVVDIGAHIGIFAMYAGTKSDTVICYEPYYENYTLLLRNAQLNSLTNVLPFRQAVGGSKGMHKLSVHATKSYGHTLYPHDHYQLAGAIDVETTTLEDIVLSNRLERIDLLKLHCEGAEYSILTNAPQAILERVDKIAIKHSGHDSVELAAFLSAKGFEVSRGEREMIYAIASRVYESSKQCVTPIYHVMIAQS